MSISRDDIRERFHKLVQVEDSESDWDAVMSIGTAARILGLSASALRKYEKEGLLLFQRTESGRRLLCRADVRRVEMIQHMIKHLGLNMEGIRRLLALLPCWRLKPCTENERRKCTARDDPLHPCWMTNTTECALAGIDCRACNVYRYGAYCTDIVKALVFEHSPEESEDR